MTIPELFVSVDVEASGPIPGEFSLLSIGAVLVDRPETTFYIELKPEGTRHDPESLGVSGFNIDELTLSGIEPSAAMQDFGNWLSDSCTQDQKPVFVGLNAAFDWSFVNYYFHKYCGTNPFGFAALDIKALYMGVVGCRWDQDQIQPNGEATSSRALWDAQRPRRCAVSSRTVPSTPRAKSWPELNRLSAAASAPG